MTSTLQLGFDFDSPRKREPELRPSERIGDITQRKSKGHRNSVAAHLASSGYHASMRERVRVWVAACEQHGATLREVATVFGKQLNQISGRFSQLKADGLIFDSGRDREGCTVWVSRRQWVNGSEEA